MKIAWKHSGCHSPCKLCIFIKCPCPLITYIGTRMGIWIIKRWFSFFLLSRFHSNDMKKMWNGCHQLDPKNGLDYGSIVQLCLPHQISSCLLVITPKRRIINDISYTQIKFLWNPQKWWIFCRDRVGEPMSCPCALMVRQANPQRRWTHGSALIWWISMGMCI